MTHTTHMTFQDYVAFTSRVTAIIRDDKGAAAVLRRGLGKTPDRQPETYGIVVPLLPDNASRTDSDVCFALANYIAATRDTPSRQRSNLGDSIRSLDSKRRTTGTDTPSTLEQQLISLNREQSLAKALTQKLPRLITRIASAKSPAFAPDWARLGSDLARWRHTRHATTATWLSTYHVPTRTETETEVEAAAPDAPHGDHTATTE